MAKTGKPLKAGKLKAPDARRKLLKGKAYVFTSAQNNTKVHEKFLASLLMFCNHKQAELIVSPFTYAKNEFKRVEKDDHEAMKRLGAWYDEKIIPHIINESMQVAPDLVFCGEMNILPTATSPLSDLGNYSRNASSIIPHAKVAMCSVPRVTPEEHPRFLYTTGAVTMRNYIKKKAGQKADFHHVFGALYVEIDEDGTWFARQLIASTDGTFYDLDEKFTPDGVESGVPVEALTYGDIHAEKLDPMIASLSWGKTGDSMLDVLKPKYQFVHDLIDFRARNHHNLKDPFFLAKMRFQETDDVALDVVQASVVLQGITRPDVQTLVVESNHDQALERWLREADIRNDPQNAVFFHEASAEMYKAIWQNRKDFSIFKWAITRLFKQRAFPKTRFLREDESFLITGDIECALHGHRGPNGARGNPSNLKNIGRKVNSGHTHSAGIIDGVYTAGVSGSLRMDYNKGPTSWSHSHIVTYKNGKRAIVTIRNNKWRLK